MATANTLYSNFVDAADSGGNIKNDKAILMALSTLANTIVRIGDSKFKAVYPFVGGSAFSHKFNFMNPVDSDGAFRLGFNGGLTHSGTGILPDGTTGYASTFLNPSLHLSLNNTHLSYYSRTNSSGVKIEIGCNEVDSDFKQLNLLLRYSGVAYSDQYSVVSGGRISIAITDSRGMFLSNRPAINSHSLLRNNEIIALSTISQSGSLPNAILDIFRYNSSNVSLRAYSDKQSSFVSIGEAFTSQQAQFLSHQIKFIQGILGRQ